MSMNFKSKRNSCARWGLAGSSGLAVMSPRSASPRSTMRMTAAAPGPERSLSCVWPCLAMNSWIGGGGRESPLSGRERKGAQLAQLDILVNLGTAHGHTPAVGKFSQPPHDGGHPCRDAIPFPINDRGYRPGGAGTQPPVNLCDPCRGRAWYPLSLLGGTFPSTIRFQQAEQVVENDPPLRVQCGPIEVA